MKSLIAAVLTASTLTLSASALADPSSPDPGCHGYDATQYKVAHQDRGAQGTAIGGRGKSDGDPSNGQAHSQPGRGPQLQQLLATDCGVGSQVHPASPQPASDAGSNNGGSSQGEHGRSHGASG